MQLNHLKVLLDPKLDKCKVCSVWPVAVENSSMFLWTSRNWNTQTMCERISFKSRSIQALIYLCLFKARVTEEEEVEVLLDKFFFTCKDTIVIIHQTQISNNWWHLFQVGYLWFTPSGSTTFHTRFGNVYYHCSVACIFAVWPPSVPSSVVVPPHIHAQLDFARRVLFAVWHLSSITFITL